jgi:hypothetical protein
MVIETKFNAGDKVFFKYKGRHEKALITDIFIEAKASIQKQRVSINYILKSEGSIYTKPEKEVFKTTKEIYN